MKKYLHENVSQYSQGNAESANLKTSCLFIKIFIYQQQFKKTPVEVLLHRYKLSPTL